MHTITITENSDVQEKSELPGHHTVTVFTVETGDHIIITRNVDKAAHRLALTMLRAEMNARKFDITKETATDVLREIRGE